MPSDPPATSPPAPLADALRDRYLLERELGRGGMAIVYLARDLRHERPVALKVILPDAAGLVNADRFHREIRIAAALQHPNILPVFDSGRTEGQSWYTMPYVAGETLRRRLEREGPLAVEESVRLAREIADALACAHAHGVVHRDIKPENILLSGSHALVADFGVARLAGPAEAGLTAAGLAVGSPAYMSPEQAGGEEVDGRSDIYALGCVLFEMLVGRPPFTAPTPLALMARRLVQPVPALRAHRPEAPAWLEAVLQRALARDPAERFGHAAELAVALIGAPTGDGSTPRPGPSRVEVTAPELVEREEYLERLDRLLVSAVAGAGATAVVSGEAGIGKTSLVEEFTRERTTVRVLWGWCEALFTPRTLGPLHDVAAQLGGPLEEALRSGSNRESIFATLLAELGPGGMPTVLVLEDVHWADEATLDLLKFLGRRAPRLPLLLVVTVRDDELGPAHPLRSVLGDLPRGAVRRLELAPLSEPAVATLARRAGRQIARLHEATGGNPFYVTEVLATSQSAIPVTVRDAVLARVSRASAAAREAFEIVSVIPGKADPWLIERILGRDAPGVEEGLASGMLTRDRHGLGFRHELARRAVEESLAPGHRRATHTRVLAALEAAPAGMAPARLVHHAEGAGDAGAVQRYAPVAAAKASALGAHREAAAHYEAGLRFAEGVRPEVLAGLLEGRSYEDYLIDRLPEAIAAREEALTLWRRLGDRRREGAALRWLSRLCWSDGRRADAERRAAEAVAVLEPLGIGPELAMAYSNLAQLHMLAAETREAEAWGAKAIALAERLGDTETLVHALTNVGAAEQRSLVPDRGVDKLERALGLALDAGYQEHIARCYACLVPAYVVVRNHARAERWLDEGLAYTEPRDLDFWSGYLRSWRAQLRLDQGRWAEAEHDSSELLEQTTLSPVSRITALCVLALLRARRGLPNPTELLEEARTLAARTKELQRLGPVALARAEAAWLAGDVAASAAEARPVFELSLAKDTPWTRGMLAVWLHRVGALGQTPDEIPAVCALELAGDARAAAAEWARLQCPYEEALALAGAGGSDALEAIRRLERLGAHASARAVGRSVAPQRPA